MWWVLRLDTSLRASHSSRLPVHCEYSGLRIFTHDTGSTHTIKHLRSGAGIDNDPLFRMPTGVWTARSAPQSRTSLRPFESAPRDQAGDRCPPMGGEASWSGGGNIAPASEFLADHLPPQLPALAADTHSDLVQDSETSQLGLDVVQEEPQIA
jgi:hypothetical protein